MRRIVLAKIRVINRLEERPGRKKWKERTYVDGKGVKILMATELLLPLASRGAVKDSIPLLSVVKDWRQRTGTSGEEKEEEPYGYNVLCTSLRVLYGKI